MENCFQNTNCFSWIKLILVLIHFKYCYYNTPSLERPCLLCCAYQVLPLPTETSHQRNLYHVFHRFPYFFLLYSTSRHYYWMYQTICQAEPIKLIINLYLNLLSTYQKAKSPRAASLSKLDTAFNKNSIFNAKCACVKFFTKW